MTRVLAFVAFLAAAGAPAAAEDVRVRARVEPPEAYVGQRVSVTLDVLTTEFFTSQPEVKAPQVAALALLPAPVSKGPLTDTIGGTRYSGVTFEFLAFPLKAGVIEIPPFEVAVRQRGEQGRDVTRRPVMAPLSFRATMPPGAEALNSLICTPELKVTETWAPVISGRRVAASVGDAWARTVTMEAPDLLGMVLPPLPDLGTPELRTYRQPPVVRDAMDRGNLTGHRAETITFVAERPGFAELPELVIPWWDTDDHVLRRSVVPRISFQIEPPVEPAGPDASARNATPRDSAALRIAALGLVAGLTVGGIALGRRRFERPESRRFRDLRRAVRRSDAAGAERALLAWLDAAAPDEAGEPLLERAVSRQSAAGYEELVRLELAVASMTDHWDGRSLLCQLSNWRGSRPSPADSDPLLPPLNPSGPGS